MDEYTFKQLLKLILLVPTIVFIFFITNSFLNSKKSVLTPPPPTPEIVYKYTAEFSAYSLSESETDGDPCTGARSLNLCKLKPILEERGLKICASRDLPLDTMIDIEGVGQCIILDRMNLRYLGTGNIDILMDSKEVANDFGRKEVRYNIIN